MKTELSDTKAPRSNVFTASNRRELVGTPVVEYFHPDDRDRVETAFETIVSSTEYTVEAVEYRHRRADGSYVWVESVASTNPTPTGHYVVNTRDISNLKEREQRLKLTNERLEEFASVIGHDLKNPLTIAQGRLRLLSEECESDHLDAIDTAHQRMDMLIDELLTLSRAGKRPEETESIPLEALAERCWETVETSGATLVIDTDRRVEADRNRLRQLFENLIRNAVEHGSNSTLSQAHEGTIERARSGVTITIGEIDGGFYVEDDGRGIDPDAIDRVFETGYSSEDGGTGLGLSIVKRVADAHGWTVRPTESADGGARFEITDIND